MWLRGNLQGLKKGVKYACVPEKEYKTLQQQRNDLLEACEETQKLFGFIAENYKSAPHFPNAERLVDAAIALCK